MRIIDAELFGVLEIISWPKKLPNHVSSTAIGAAIAIQIRPSIAKTISPRLKTIRVRKAIFLDSLYVIVLLYPNSIVEANPMSNGVKMKRAIPYSPIPYIPQTVNGPANRIVRATESHLLFFISVDNILFRKFIIVIAGNVRWQEASHRHIAIGCLLRVVIR
ncbi:hypothetical protein, partial [Pontibacter qinzhouensis]|uniref:hypothetical protein n=1 Tax=Pontibacter qinzhouensis TaxID=2603253 RepID=UPI00210839F7